MKETAVKFILLRVTLMRPRKDIGKWWYRASRRWKVFIPQTVNP